MILTNYLGVAFTALALSANDARVTVVYQEDGVTNSIAWTQLAPVSRQAVSDALDFAPVPPDLASTFSLAQRECRRITALESDGRLDPPAASSRLAAVSAAFLKRCRARGLDPRTCTRLSARLNLRDGPSPGSRPAEK